MSEFADLFGTRVELAIENEGRPWRVVYDPSLWPVVHQVRVVNEAISWDEVIEILAQVLVEWDLTMDGQPMPCDEATLRRFPTSVLGQIHGRIFMEEAGIVPGADDAEGSEKKSGPAGTSL